MSNLLNDFLYKFNDFILRLQAQGVVYYYALWGISIGLFFLAAILFAKTQSAFLKLLSILAIIAIGSTLIFATKGIL